MYFKRKKDKNVKAFNMIANKSEAKVMAKHMIVKCDSKIKFNGRTCNSNKKWNMSMRV